MGKKDNQEQYLRFTAEMNALDYLERAEEFIKQTESNMNAWKWVIIALHGALYGFAITACMSTNFHSVTKPTKKGRRHLISFDEAIKKCQNKAMMGTLIGGEALQLSESQKDSIRKLKKALRNNFEHSIPGSWLIEIHGLPQIAIDVLDVIRFLAVETFRYQHLNTSQRRRVKSIVYQSKRLLRKSTTIPCR